MNLQLSLKRKWFEMTAAGIKTEDYREINPYWLSRLVDWPRDIHWSANDFVREFEYHADELGFLRTHAKCFLSTTMTLGYPKRGDASRIIQFEHAGIEIRTGNPEWGAEPGKLYFVIKHGKRI